MKRLLIILLLVVSILGTAAFGGAVAVYIWASRDLPNFTSVTDYRPPLVTTVYARDGRVLGHFYREKRFLARLGEMPDHLPKAFLAAEDQDFYNHPGIDLTAILRAFIKNLRAGSIVQGGSTITQQIVKRLLLTSERSYERKLKEAILSYRLEHYLTKDEILTIYLNQIYLGARAYGVEAAARTYFARHVGELTLAQSALLAGLPQAPSRYDPLRYPEAAKARQRYVLSRMLDQGWITREQHDQALAEELEYTSMADPSWGLGAYYLEEVRRWLITWLSPENMAAQGIELDRYGEDAVYESGLHVYTAIDLDHQAAAEKALRAGLEASTMRRGWQGPVDHLEPEGLRGLPGQEPGPGPGLHQDQWIRVLVTGSRTRRARTSWSASAGRLLDRPRGRQDHGLVPHARPARSAPGKRGRDHGRRARCWQPGLRGLGQGPGRRPVPGRRVQAPGPGPGAKARGPGRPGVHGTGHGRRAGPGGRLRLRGPASSTAPPRPMRQPGSAFKPIVYLRGVRQRLHRRAPWSWTNPVSFMDPVTLQGLASPSNYSENELLRPHAASARPWSSRATSSPCRWPTASASTTVIDRAKRHGHHRGHATTSSP